MVVNWHSVLICVKDCVSSYEGAYKLYYIFNGHKQSKLVAIHIDWIKQLKQTHQKWCFLAMLSLFIDRCIFTLKIKIKNQQRFSPSKRVQGAIATHQVNF